MGSVGNMSEPVSLRIRGEAAGPPQNITLLLYFATGDGGIDVLLSPESNPKKRVGDLKYSLLKQVRCFPWPTDGDGSRFLLLPLTPPSESCDRCCRGFGKMTWYCWLRAPLLATWPSSCL